jgi:hypothetical protein
MRKRLHFRFMDTDHKLETLAIIAGIIYCLAVLAMAAGRL